VLAAVTYEAREAPHAAVGLPCGAGQRISSRPRGRRTLIFVLSAFAATRVLPRRVFPEPPFSLAKTVHMNVPLDAAVPNGGLADTTREAPTGQVRRVMAVPQSGHVTWRHGTPRWCDTVFPHLGHTQSPPGPAADPSRRPWPPLCPIPRLMLPPPPDEPPAPPRGILHVLSGPAVDRDPRVFIRGRGRLPRIKTGYSAFVLPSSV
jgi:hypothetical protein